MQNDQSVNNPWMETQLDLTLERGSEAGIFIIKERGLQGCGVMNQILDRPKKNTVENALTQDVLLSTNRASVVTARNV